MKHAEDLFGSQGWSPRQRPRKRKQVSSQQQSGDRSLGDAARANNLDEELGKLRLLFDE